MILEKLVPALNELTLKVLYKVCGVTAFRANCMISTNNPKMCNNVSVVIRAAILGTTDKCLSLIQYRMLSILTHLINGEVMRVAKTWTEQKAYISLTDSWSETFNAPLPNASLAQEMDFAETYERARQVNYDFRKVTIPWHPWGAKAKHSEAKVPADLILCPRGRFGNVLIVDYLHMLPFTASLEDHINVSIDGDGVIAPNRRNQFGVGSSKFDAVRAQFTQKIKDVDMDGISSFSNWTPPKADGPVKNSSRPW